MRQKAFGYLRVSGLTQLHGSGFDRQLDTITEYAKRQGFEIVRVFQEGVSGTKDADDRPEFKEMVSEILANSVQVIIVERLDRLARDLMVQTSILAYLKSKDITLIDAGTGENVIEAMDSDPMRKAMVRIQAVFAELEKDQIVKRLKAARDRKRALTGRKVGGPRRYGEDSPEEQATIRHIRALRRTKRGGHKGLTYAGIARRLNAEGIPSMKPGKLWLEGTVFKVLHRKG